LKFSLTGIFFVAIVALFSCKVAVTSTPVFVYYSSTQVSITFNVCAGAGGAPDGFTIQWMTKADNDANGWPVDFNNPTKQPTFCKASFSGNANLSRYNLAKGRCVLVNIGESLFENGASTGCRGALTCGTAYVFRSSANATSRANKSAFSENEICSTLACGSTGQ
jgi:hypothetical protein